MCDTNKFDMIWCEILFQEMRLSTFLLINNTLDGLFDDIFIEFILALVALHAY